MGIKQKRAPVLASSQPTWHFIHVFSFQREIAVKLVVRVIYTCAVLVIGIKKVKKHLTGDRTYLRFHRLGSIAVYKISHKDIL
ncbi:hypothetical protein D3C76_1502080 [compost metagenome]